MEGQGNSPLPEDKGASKKKNTTKIIAIVVVVILIASAIGAAFWLMGGDEENPTAVINVNSGVVDIGDSVIFNATGTDSPNGDISNYTWYFGDGDVGYSTTPSTSHVYVLPGNYMAVLQVTDEKDKEDATWTSPVSVIVSQSPDPTPSNDSKPVPVINTDKNFVDSGELVFLDGNASVGKELTYNANAWNYTTDPRHKGLWAIETSWEFIDEYEWSFSDGKADMIGNNETVRSPGNMTFSGTEGSMIQITLKVTSTKGNVESFVKTIIINPKDAGTSAKVNNPDTFVMSSIGDPESFDPAYDYESAGIEVIQNVYETLVFYDGEDPNKLKPMLATNVPTVENGGVSADGLNYTYHLRAGVKFHDGTTMDGDDVKYSISRTLLSNNYFSPSWMLGNTLIPGYIDIMYKTSPRNIGGDEVLTQDIIDERITVSADKMNVTFHLVSPYPGFNKIMAFTVCSVQSMEFVEAHGGSPILGRNNYMDTHECGTGPFVLASWQKGTAVKLERFDGYWGEKAKLKFVIIEKLEDQSQRLWKLQKGEADCIDVMRQNMLDVRGNPDYRIGEGNGTFQLEFIGFTHDIQSGGPSNGNIPSDFFADLNVRQAFVHALNYTAYVNDVLKGTAIQPNGPIPQGMFGYSDDVAPYDFDLVKTAEYLNKSESDTPGMSWGEKGFEIVLYFNAGNDDREKGLIILQEALESLDEKGLIEGDIQVSVQGLDWSTAYLPAQRAGQLSCFFLGWLVDYNDPDDFALPMLHSVLGTYPSTCLWENLTINAMVIEAAGETNETKRAQMYENLTIACMDNAYYMWLSQPTNFHVERAWVQGYYFNPMFSGLYYAPIYKEAP